MTDDRDEDDKTPVAAPEAKKRFPARRTSSSGMPAVPAPAEHECPKCCGLDDDCSVCKGKGKVTLSIATDYLLEQGKAPDTERNDR